MVISSKLRKLFFLCILFIILLLVMVCFSKQASSIQVSSLYEVAVPVTSQMNDERNTAITKAFLKVLVKVTGQHNPKIQEILKKASDYVQSFSYENHIFIEKTQLFLKIRFDESAINRLLRENNLGIWSANRSDTIIWLVIEEMDMRSIQNKTSSSEFIIHLKEIMVERSLPLTFPIMDFEDNLTISTIDICEFFKEKLIKASIRYGSDAILAGCLSVNNSQYNGRVVLLFNNQHFDIIIVDFSAQQLAVVIADLIGNTLSEHYAVYSGYSGSMNPVVEVSNVNTLQDYAGVINYLYELTAIQDVIVTKINGTSLKLELVIDGTLNQLLDAIVLGCQFQPVIQNKFDKILQYQWFRNCL